jgi:hypothetical protein
MWWSEGVLCPGLGSLGGEGFPGELVLSRDHPSAHRVASAFWMSFSMLQGPKWPQTKIEVAHETIRRAFRPILCFRGAHLQGRAPPELDAQAAGLDPRLWSISPWLWGVLGVKGRLVREELAISLGASYWLPAVMENPPRAWHPGKSGPVLALGPGRGGRLGPYADFG